MSRRAVSFECAGAALTGIIDEPSALKSATGVVIVTGGPQYRVGSHRQFVQLAAYLADSGYACLRFDHRGSGDSDGTPVAFDTRDDDIRAAIDCLLNTVAGLQRVVLWGLCDAASSALIYAHSDDRVAGLVLLNPWVRRVNTEAQTQIKVYYRSRLTDRQFWRRLLTGKVQVLRSVASLVSSFFKAVRKPDADKQDFVDRMRAGAHRYAGPVLVILSGQDLTAQEFTGVASTAGWSDWYQRRTLDHCSLPDANHTFSRAEWKNAVSAATLEWLEKTV